MRLLIFNLATDIDDPILGFTTHWIGALAQRVEFIHVITMRAGRLAAAKNVRVHSLGKEKGYSKGRRVIEFYKILRRVLREDRIDACFSHMIPLFTILGAPLLKARGIPIVTWYAHPAVTWNLKTAHKLSNQVVTSTATAYPYKHDKLTPIGHGIAMDIFFPDQGERADEPPIILCVGRLSPVKDHPTLLRAAALLRQARSKSFRVVIVGGPATSQDEIYVRSLNDQTKQLGLDDIVDFEPPLPMRKLPAWYRRCAVHVNMSPTGFGDKVALEPMSCAKPSLVANEGFRETLGRYGDELLYRYRDETHLAERLNWVLGLSQQDRDRIGAYLREQVVSMHCVDSLAQRLVNLLASLKRPTITGAQRESRESR
jgi:glycosyltransferase involved in cell wall biosynthesis